MSKFAPVSVSKFMVAIIQEVGSGQYCGIRKEVVSDLVGLHDAPARGPG